MDAICLSRQIFDCSSKEHFLSTLRPNFDDISPGVAFESGS